MNLIDSNRAAWQGVDRRGETRTGADYEAYVSVVDPYLSTARVVGGRITGVSARGFQLRIGFIFPNESVQVQLPDRIVFGRVRYCRGVGNDFRVGVQLSDAC